MKLFTENNFGTGAWKLPKVKWVLDREKLGGDSAPFDWNVGFDIRDLLFHKTGLSEIPTKNQNGSFSCGGQAVAYLVGILDAIRDHQYIEKSARFIYAPVRARGGGSSEEALINRIINVGCAEERLVLSYDNKQPPTEEFMSKVDDIDQTDIQNALSAKGLKPVYLLIDIDSLAKAIRDNGGFIMGVEGENNGTWLSEFPKPPSELLKPNWRHWVYFGQAKMINGKKMIAMKNSWGDVGDNGWQWIGEDYVGKYTWGAWSVVLVEPPPEVYVFNVTLRLGDRGGDVQRLQAKLKQLGFFPQAQAVTSYFGNITFGAVKEFQKKYNIPQTGLVGSLTRAQLNKIG